MALILGIFTIQVCDFITHLAWCFFVKSKLVKTLKNKNLKTYVDLK